MSEPASPGPDELCKFLSANLPQFIWMNDESGAIEFSNRHFAEYLGVIPENIAGLREMVHPEDLESLAARIGESARTGQDFETDHGT